MYRVLPVSQRPTVECVVRPSRDSTIRLAYQHFSAHWLVHPASRSPTVDGMERRIQTPIAQGRPTKNFSMIQWIRTSRLSMKNSLSLERLSTRSGWLFLAGWRSKDSARVGAIGLALEPSTRTLILLSIASLSHDKSFCMSTDAHQGAACWLWQGESYCPG